VTFPSASFSSSSFIYRPPDTPFDAPALAWSRKFSQPPFSFSRPPFPHSFRVSVSQMRECDFPSPLAFGFPSFFSFVHVPPMKGVSHWPAYASQMARVPERPNTDPCVQLPTSPPSPRGARSPRSLLPPEPAPTCLVADRSAFSIGASCVGLFFFPPNAVPRREFSQRDGPILVLSLPPLFFLGFPKASSGPGRRREAPRTRFQKLPFLILPSRTFIEKPLRISL